MRTGKQSRRQVSPVVVLAALIALTLVLFAIYKLTLGKDSADTARLPAGAYTPRTGQADSDTQDAWDSERRVFVCPDCGQTFRLPGQFRAHRSQAHGKGAVPPMLPKRGSTR